MEKLRQAIKVAFLSSWSERASEVDESILTIQFKDAESKVEMTR